MVVPTQLHTIYKQIQNLDELKFTDYFNCYHCISSTLQRPKIQILAMFANKSVENLANRQQNQRIESSKIVCCSSAVGAIQDPDKYKNPV